MSVTKPFDAKEALDRMRERTRETRERVAGEVFSIANVNDVLSEASAAGLSAAFFEPENPMDLSGATAAVAMVETLRRAGFLVEWQTRQKVNGEPEKYLRVSWGTDAKGHSD
ncbi:hypothetical protein HEP89_29560 (plasmid) [Labrenzia sp. 5N]|uniref:hypothetical protein n=1 Tax=Labrenzia sp. 5N TaxID=2723402 RepID=UPI00144647E6|nr:hypothetical protein [Labrenzia sp. 5N]NKX68287.1 hypothetical protein [Labrenzia sp. 5N]